MAKSPKPDDVVLTLVERVDAVEKAVKALQHQWKAQHGYEVPDAPEPVAEPVAETVTEGDDAA